MKKLSLVPPKGLLLFSLYAHQVVLLWGRLLCLRGRLFLVFDLPCVREKKKKKKKKKKTKKKTKREK